MRYFALDVETADHNSANICRIGIVEYEENKLINTYDFLINPEVTIIDKFVKIHKITNEQVENKPTFLDVYGDLKNIIQNNIVFQHTNFDQQALSKACQKYDLNFFTCFWIDSSICVKRFLPEFRQKGFGLSNVAKHFSIQFNHHDPVEDAKTSFEISYKIANLRGLNLVDFILYNKFDPDFYENSEVNKNVNLLEGKKVCFAGTPYLNRKELSLFSQQYNFTIVNNVKNSDVLVDATKGKSKKSEEAKKLGIEILDKFKFYNDLGIKYIVDENSKGKKFKFNSSSNNQEDYIDQFEEDIESVDERKNNNGCLILLIVFIVIFFLFLMF